MLLLLTIVQVTDDNHPHQMRTSKRRSPTPARLLTRLLTVRVVTPPQTPVAIAILQNRRKVKAKQSLLLQERKRLLPRSRRRARKATPKTTRRNLRKLLPSRSPNPRRRKRATTRWTSTRRNRRLSRSQSRSRSQRPRSLKKVRQRRN